MKVVNHSHPTTFARSRAAPAYLSNTAASENQVAGVGIVGDETDEFQTLILVPYIRGLGGERFHLDYRDRDTFHFLSAYANGA